MLPTDDLVNAFAFFDADELERLQIVCRPFLGLVDAHFENQPLRQVSCYIASDFVGFKRPTQPGLAMFAPPKATKVNYDEIEKWLRRALVGNLEFHCNVDDRLIDALLPFASKFRKATCRVPTRFDTTDSLLRAFLELLLCDTMIFQKFSVGGDVGGEVNYIDNFRFLVSDRFPVNGLVDWLHEGERKHFHAQYSIRDSADFVLEFKAALVEKFKEATSPTSFKVTLSFAGRGVADAISETLENETTGEVLAVAEDSSDLDGFISDVRYTFTRRTAADEEEDEEEVATDEYWDFGEDNMFNTDFATMKFEVHPWFR